MTGYTTTDESRVGGVYVRFRVDQLASQEGNGPAAAMSQATLRPIQRRRSRSCQASTCCLSERGNCDGLLHPITVVLGTEAALCSVVAGAASSRSRWFSPCRVGLPPLSLGLLAAFSSTAR